MGVSILEAFPSLVAFPFSKPIQHAWSFTVIPLIPLVTSAQSPALVSFSCADLFQGKDWALSGGPPFSAYMPSLGDPIPSSGFSYRSCPWTLKFVSLV